jgi:hypothetical protein
MGRCIGSTLVSWCLGIAATGWVSTARAQSFELADEYALPAVGVVWAAGDFDGDGDTDVAIVTADGGITTASNDGHGSFTATVAGAGVPIGGHQLPGSAQAVAVDYDGDGNLDLLVSMSALAREMPPCSVHLARGRGDGTFELAGQLTAVSDLPSDLAIQACAALAAADYDGDGAVDLALAFATFDDGAGSLHGLIDVFGGDGGGGFEAPTITDFSETRGWVSFALASADFDGDGKLDLGLGEDVVFSSGLGGARLQILSGDGALHFFPTSTVDPPVADVGLGTFVSARAADVNGDGRLDLLVASDPGYAGSFPRVLPVILAPGVDGGQLSTASPVAAEFYGVSYEFADFSGDQLPDILDVSAEDRASLSRGDGRGNFVSSAAFATGGDVSASLAADFDANGRSDFAVLDAVRPVFRMALDEPNGPGLALPRVTALGAASEQVYLAANDFDGDGNTDVLVSEQSAFEVMLGAGDGTFTPGAHIASNATPARLLVGDVNHDALPDLVLPAPGASLQTLFGSADGSFSGVTSVDSGVAGEFGEGALGDFDADGDLDAAVFRVTGVGTPPTPTAAVRLYVNDGDGHFSLANELPSTTLASRVLFADLNGDGRLDLFVGSSPQSSSSSGSALTPGDSLSWLGDGAGGFTREVSGFGAAAQFELGDIDGDERLDLVTNTSVALGNGDGTFGAPTTVDAAGVQVALGDLDDDGVLDRVTLDPASLGVARGNGDGSFEPASPLFAITRLNPALPVLGLADFTGDSQPDLAFVRLPLISSDAPRVPELVTIVGPKPEAPPPPVHCGPPRHHAPRRFYHRRPSHH